MTRGNRHVVIARSGNKKAKAALCGPEGVYHFRINSGYLNGSNGRLPSLLINQTLLVSRTCNKSTPPPLSIRLFIRRLPRLAIRLSRFSDSAFAIPVMAVFLRDRLMVSFLYEKTSYSLPLRLTRAPNHCQVRSRQRIAPTNPVSGNASCHQ